MPPEKGADPLADPRFIACGDMREASLGPMLSPDGPPEDPRREGEGHFGDVGVSISEQALAGWRAGGGSGIRTREGVAPLHALQACPFVRSGKPPGRLYGKLASASRPDPRRSAKTIGQLRAGAGW